MIDSNRWKQSGTVSLWRYRENHRNYPGWHFSADAAGCASLIDLMDALLDGTPGAARTVLVTAPTAAVLSVPNNRNATVDAPSSLRWVLAAEEDAWRCSLIGERLVLEVGKLCVPLLRQGIVAVAAGGGDFNIDTEAGPVWFWWWPTRG